MESAPSLPLLKYLLLYSCHLLPERVSVCIYLYNYKKALTLQCILYYVQYIRGWYLTGSPVYLGISRQRNNSSVFLFVCFYK